MKRAQGLNYVRFFNRLHSAYLFDWYLEIGCRTGRILDMVQGKTIGVDPVFRLDRPLLGTKTQLHLFQETSDAFFAANRLEALRARPAVAFIDGMHLYEYALRDILNTEAHADPNGVLFVHDCVPFDLPMTTRDLDNLPAVWTGDVWKLVPILAEYRPDLKLTMLDAQPTGILAIQNLKPKEHQPQIDLDAIHADFEALDLETFGADRFGEMFEFVDTKSAIEDDIFNLATLADPSLAMPRPSLVTP